MTVKQTEEQDGPAALTIFFTERLSSTASTAAANISDKHAPAPSPTEKTVVLDAKNLDYKEIWRRVKDVTGAQEVPATPEEQAELEKLEKMRAQAEVDRVRVAGIRQAKKDQERMLQEARGEVEKLRQL
jgi:large subunit ribosomal protein MRP49